jgi:hypothetical protein
MLRVESSDIKEGHLSAPHIKLGSADLLYTEHKPSTQDPVGRCAARGEVAFGISDKQGRTRAKNDARQLRV